MFLLYIFTIIYFYDKGYAFLSPRLNPLLECLHEHCNSFYQSEKQPDAELLFQGVPFIRCLKVEGE